MADLRQAIVAKLDEYALDHQPCDPGADCLHRPVDALRVVVDRHQAVPWHSGAPYGEAHHTICQDIGWDHPEHRCAGCSALDDDGSGTTVAYPCGELAGIAQTLGVQEVPRG